MKLQQTEKCVKIAEFCGFKWVNGKEWCWECGEIRTLSVPDYFNDLNAINEAESKLSDGQHREFRRHLNYSLFERGMTISHATRKLVSATAAQRAEAFGKALNLW